MKFKLTTTEDQYLDSIPRISDYISGLREIGFKFTKKSGDRDWLVIQKPIDIEISSLDDLVELSKFNPIIIRENEIEIYDGHHS